MLASRAFQVEATADHFHEKLLTFLDVSSPPPRESASPPQKRIAGARERNASSGHRTSREAPPAAHASQRAATGAAVGLLLREGFLIRHDRRGAELLRLSLPGAGALVRTRACCQLLQCYRWQQRLAPAQRMWGICAPLPRNCIADCSASAQVAKVDAARTEILAALRRRKHHEATESALVSTKLRSSGLGWQFHLEDTVGKGLLDRVMHGNVVIYRISRR
jgi:hypothetical protein